MWSFSVDKGRGKACSCTKIVQSKLSMQLSGQHCCHWSSSGGLPPAVRRKVNKMKCLCPMVHLCSMLHGDGFGYQECFCQVRPLLSLSYCCQFTQVPDVTCGNLCREPLFLELYLLCHLSQIMQGKVVASR